MCDLCEYHCLYDTNQHIEPPKSDLDNHIASSTSGAGETALSTQKVVTTFLFNHWFNQHETTVSNLLLDCLLMVLVMWTPLDNSLGPP